MIAMYLNVTEFNVCCETTYSLLHYNDCNVITLLYIQVDIVVSQQNGEHLAALKAKYEVLVSQLVNDYAFNHHNVYYNHSSVFNRARMVLHPQRWSRPM